MASMLMSAHTFPNRRGKTSYARIIAKQLETAFHFILVKMCLSQSELFNAIDKDIENFAFGLFSQPIAIHAQLHVRPLSVRLP